MIIRVLTPADATAYRDLRLRALREWPPGFGTPAEEEEQLSLTDFEDRLVETENRCFIGALEEQILIGCIRLSRYESLNESHRAYLAGLYVMPEHRKRGFGRGLCIHAVSRAKLDGTLRRLNLTVGSEQKPAITLYQSLGFTQYGIEKEVFEARGLFFDEILMTLDLKK